MFLKTQTIYSINSLACRFAKNKLWRKGLVSLAILAILPNGGCGHPTANAPKDMGDQAVEGRILWRDLLTRDASKAKAFYGTLFGWEFRTQGKFCAILRDGQEIGGIVEIPDAPDTAADRWVPSMAVKSLEQAIPLTEQKGGQINEGPMKLGDRGTGALVRDAGGAQFVLLQAASAHPVSRPLNMNDWLWDELWTDDVPESIDYYSALAGFSANQEQDGYWILTSDGTWQAGVRKVFNEQFVQRWVPVVRVADSDETGKKAQDLGGRIWVEAPKTKEHQKAALISDPAGGLFIVQEWATDTEQGRE